MILFTLIVFLFLGATDAYAQASGVGQPFDWRQLIGVLINTVGVMAVVQGIKAFQPVIAEKYGYSIPVLATVLGPALMWLQGVLSTWLGFQGFDFTPITAALTGSAAVAAHQFYAQAKKSGANVP